MKKMFTVFFLMACFSSFAATPPQLIIYVSQNANGANDGTSWSDAYTKLQDALAAATSGYQVWVAAGTYYPDEGSGKTNGDLNASFVMKNGVAIYGGFSSGENQLSERNWKTNTSILSGDIGTPGDKSDNSYHVISNDNNGLNNTALLDGFTITGGNGSNVSGNGGGMYNNSSSPTVSNCTFLGNLAWRGGGIYNASSSPAVTNCVFTGNSATNGGGMNNEFSSPSITNCIFTANSAFNHGGGMANDNSSSPSLINCSFSGNSAASGGGIYIYGTNPVLKNCILWGNNSSSFPEIENENSTPIISNSIVKGSGYNGTDGNLDKDPLFVNAAIGDLHLQPCSPAINAGTATNAPSIDFDGNGRPALGKIDIGAYEFQAPVTGGIVYVNAAATGANNGTSWTNAFTKLQDALTKVRTCHDQTQVWVAKGTYYPDEGTGYTNNERRQSFSMESGVAIYGGFAGGETQFSQRNLKNNITTLSGDINQDDGTGMSNQTNAEHVVLCNSVNNTASLDGFTITKGYATEGDTYYDQNGGGLFALNSSANIVNCRFVNNYALDQGGGIANLSSSTRIINCIFTGNSAIDGGGISNIDSQPVIINCSFSGNQAYEAAGAIFGNASFVTITNCIVWNNTEGQSKLEIFDDHGTSTLVVTNSIIKEGYAGTNVIDNDPLFVNAASGDLRLQACSPAIDAGLNSASTTSFDLDGNARISHTTIDIGAYEYSGELFNLYTDADGDGYGSANISRTSFCPTLSSNESTNNTDCQDDNSAVNPGATEICGNGIDDNCNGQVDENCGSCGNATALNTTGITSNSATLNWVASVNPVQWQVEYKKITMGSKWIAIKLPGSDRSVTISSLNANQKYNWHIRAKCGKTWTSYSNTIMFKTLSSQFVSGINSQQSITMKHWSEEEALQIKLYPNPTNGQFIIELHLANNINTIAKIELLDMTGRTVQIENATFTNGILQKSITLSSALTKGIYMVRIIANDKVYKTQLIYEK